MGSSCISAYILKILNICNIKVLFNSLVLIILFTHLSYLERYTRSCVIKKNSIVSKVSGVRRTNCLKAHLAENATVNRCTVEINVTRLSRARMC